MKSKIIFLSILTIGLNLFNPLHAADLSANKKQNDTNNIYTEDKQNILITAAQPQFTIKLKSNPTTGFSWFLREYDSNLIIPVKHSFLKSTSQLVGAPGFELWTFRVKPVGFVMPQQTTIRLVYSRPWQSTDGSTQLVFRITTQK